MKKNKKFRIAKKEDRFGEPILPDFKTYYNTTII